jgi:hypothetical protein
VGGRGEVRDYENGISIEEKKKKKKRRERVGKEREKGKKDILGDNG